MANGFKLVWWWWRVWGLGLSEAVSFKLGWEAWIGDSQERGRWEPSILEDGSAGVSLKPERVRSLEGPGPCGDRLEGELERGTRVRAGGLVARGRVCSLF